MKHSCLVLGASGVVGQPVCAAMAERGWRVVAVARFGDAAKRAAVAATAAEIVPFDLTREDPARLPDVDVVVLEVWDRSQFSMACGSIDEARPIWDLNFHAVGRVVARYAGTAHIVNGSTISLYGPRADRPSRETDAPAPQGQYSLSRLAQEHLIDLLCKTAGSRAIHLRYARSNTVNFGVIRRMAELIRDARSLGNDPDQHTQVIGLDDFVRCTVSAIERIVTDEKLPQAVHVAHPRVWRQRELADRIQAAMTGGTVRFDREAGGAVTSVWVETDLMIETFGPPEQDLEALIDAVGASL